MTGTTTCDLSPQQFEISFHYLASIEGAALTYINQDNQVLLEELPSRLQMIFCGSYDSLTLSCTLGLSCSKVLPKVRHKNDSSLKRPSPGLMEKSIIFSFL